MKRRKLKLETRYAYLLRDAKILTAMLDLAATQLCRAARALEGKPPVIDGTAPTPFSLREMSSECARLAHQCGRDSRGRSMR